MKIIYATIIGIITGIAYIGFVYLVGGFLELSGDFMEWNIATRWGVAFFSIFSIPLGCVVGGAFYSYLEDM
jgi:predicted cobalt transporter CbtA